jgi:Protein of unknown function (DUF1569)
MNALAGVEVRRRALMRRGTLAQALERAERCDPDATASATGWTLPQTLAHCAQAIEFSITGFPRARSRVFQTVLGRAIKRRFLRRGVMVHNRAAALPSAPPISPDVTRAAAFERLRRAIADFEAFPGPYAPHFAYGPASKAEYEALHAMHLTDHLTAFEPRAQAM